MTSNPANGIEVVVASSVDDELVAAFGRLIPQLSRSAAVPTPDIIRQIVEAEGNTVLIARDLRDGARIVGTLTLVVFRIPTGIRAWIEDVVVDETMRGRGVGEALSQEGVSRAVALGARTVELTSRPSREAANRLYQRLGFTLRDSNVYRYTPNSPQSEDRAATQESAMIRAVDIKAELAGRPLLSGRDKDTTEAEAKGAFAVLSPFRDGSVFAGSFSGESPWERHRKGDELVHILAGAATLTIMTDAGPQSFAMTAGMLIVVPQGHWHRFHAPDGVTVLTATPQPTDHTAAADPRTVA